jgi:hypothetical protein
MCGERAMLRRTTSLRFVAVLTISVAKRKERAGLPAAELVA